MAGVSQGPHTCATLPYSDNTAPRRSHWRRAPGFPPPTIRHPEQYDGHSACLSLACTQTDLPAKQQQALIAQWCATLPTLPTLLQVRVLWLGSKVNQALLEAGCVQPAHRIASHRQACGAV